MGNTSNPFTGNSIQTSFSASSKTTPTQSTTTSNVLWGGAASALLGATLAEWKKKREEEEAARLAALQNRGGGGEEGEDDVADKKRMKVLARVNPAYARALTQERNTRAAIAKVTAQELKGTNISVAQAQARQQALWNANGQAIYDANQDFITKYGKEMDAATKEQAIKDATENGVFNVERYFTNLVTVQVNQEAKAEEQRRAEQAAMQEAQRKAEEEVAREKVLTDFRAGERDAVAVAEEYERELAMQSYRAGEQVAQEKTNGNLLSALWNASMSAVGSILSPQNGGGAKPFAMPVSLDGTPPPTPLPDGFELGRVPFHDRSSDLYNVNSFRSYIEDGDPRQYGNLSIFLGPEYSKRQTNLCGQIVVSTLTNIPLKSVLLEFAETPLGAKRLKNNTPTKPGEISLLFNNLGWSASVKGLDGNYWYGSEPSPNEINAYLANGNEVVALVKINSNDKEYGALRPNGKTGHWVSVQSIDMQSGKVTIYNPFQDQEQVYEWEDFMLAWEDEGSHTVYNYAAVIASPPASASLSTPTPTLTLTPTSMNTVAPTMTPEPVATAVPEVQQPEEKISLWEWLWNFLSGDNK